MDNIENSNSYCLLCAALKPNNKLIDLQSDNQKLDEIIEKLNRLNANTDLKENTLPKKVCFVCNTSLNKAFDFILSIEQAQTILSDIMLVQEIKKEAVMDSDEDFNYDDKFIDDLSIKLEKTDTKSKLESSKTKPKYRIKSQKKKIKNTFKSSKGLDALPLSQLKLTWTDYNWTCCYCMTQFPTINELKSHSMEYHNCCNAFKCTDCKIRKLRLNNFLIHVKRHRKYLKLSCYLCHMKFTTPHENNIHQRSHTNSEFTCAGCNTNFQSVEEMIQHTDVYYCDKRVRRIPQMENLADNLTCVLCKKTFKNRGSLNTHLLIHTERKRDHTCDKCGKCFLNRQNLAGHMILHDDTRPYQCEICKFGFKTPGQLRSHVGVHDGHKPYACDQCGRCFRLPKQLKSHHIIHTDSYPYVCSYCNKGFRFKTILNQHIRQHTGIKPYSCEQCQRDFTNWPNYNKHMKRRHGMDMAKKKHTPDGVYPINPATGEIIMYQDTDNMEKWKQQMLSQRRPGRPKTSIKAEDIKHTTCKEETKQLLNLVESQS